ncbi:hypothetical protein M4D76_24665 [Peribacillus frigoritolerans]|uniref:hypothetical protein n=1 Tax=Peribacillus frigoritolerans TaxID=450367 RepID=UPI0021A59F6C|nr:hypothetical protein [Peribacillus frigoritolerans]MCT1391459.1 hypothetical protein [Peribacillus frigoritolerans]
MEKNEITSWLVETETILLEAGLNVRTSPYLAIGDGTSHPLSERFSTLANAQVIFPHATALTDEIDWCAIQGVLNSKGQAFIPDGDFQINKAIDVGGKKLTGISRSKSKITQTKPSEAILKVQSVPLVTDLYLRHSNLPRGEEVPNGTGILLTGSVNDGSVFERLYIENTTSGFYNSDGEYHIYSTAIRDIRISRFTHSPMYIGGYGHTGNLISNIYALNWNVWYGSNDPRNSVLKSAFGFFFKGMNEGIINLINLEATSCNKGVVFSGCTSIDVNSVHFEQFHPIGNYGALISSIGRNTSLNIKNVTITYSYLDSSLTTFFSILNVGNNSKVYLDGFSSLENTLIGDKTVFRRFQGDGTIQDTASIYATNLKFIDGIFNGNDYFSISPVVPIVKRVNDNWFYWEEGGKKKVLGTAIPTNGQWKLGDSVINTEPKAGGYSGWHCIDSGYLNPPVSDVTTTILVPFTSNIKINGNVDIFTKGDRITIQGSARTFKIISTYTNGGDKYLQLDQNIEVKTKNATVQYAPPNFKGYGLIEV